MSIASTPKARLQEQVRQPERVLQIDSGSAIRWKSPSDDALEPFCYFDHVCMRTSGESECAALKFSFFGFDIPEGSTVVGIQVEIEREAGYAPVSDRRIYLVDGTPRGPDYAVETVWPEGSSVFIYPTSQQDSLWENYWSPKMVNGEHFGVQSVVSFNSPSDSESPAQLAVLRCVSMRILYLFDCPDMNNCFGNGYCNSSMACTCDKGWSGDKCSISQCVSGCGNGNCDGPDQCKCEPGWTGSKCEIRELEKVGGLSTGGWSGIVIAVGVLGTCLGFVLSFTLYMAKTRMVVTNSTSLPSTTPPPPPEPVEIPEMPRRNTISNGPPIKWKKVTSTSDWATHNPWQTGHGSQNSSIDSAEG